jgi:hypothetical protein
VAEHLVASRVVLSTTELVIMLLNCEADHSSSSTAEVKNAWSLPLLLDVFMM